MGYDRMVDDMRAIERPRRASRRQIAERLNALAEAVNEVHEQLAELRHELRVEAVEIHRRGLPVKRTRR